MNLETKIMNKSYDDLLKQFWLINLSKENIINENKEKDKANKNLKKNLKITGLNITKNIEIIDNSIQNNIPYRIKYQDVIYIIGGANHEKKEWLGIAKIIEKLKIYLIYKRNFVMYLYKELD